MTNQSLIPAKSTARGKRIKGTAWFLMVAVLVLTSCGPAATEEQKPTPVALEPKQEVSKKEAAKQEVTEKEAITASAETPKYGGIFTFQAGDPLGFDEAFTPSDSTVYMTNSRLLTGDWTRGPAGTGETDWQFGMVGQAKLFAGDLATGWEISLPDTVIFHLRKGVRWQNKAPVNGREFTADDVVYSLTRTYLERETSEMYQLTTGAGSPPKSIRAIDRYTVEIKVPPEMLGNAIFWMGGYSNILPREVIEKYGDMKDWRNSVGTGPWILADYVPGSSTTFVRNPDYFMNDPLHPENRLPYLEGVKWLNIADTSTQQAAFRTARIDRLTGMSWEDQSLFMKQRPMLKYIEKLTSPVMPVGREDKKELPFRDVRVRQALNLAVDKQEILNGYYGGHGVLFALPVPPTSAHAKLFTPLNEQPRVVQELFTYNPDKARQLLKEAGYPNGFKTQIITTVDKVDLLAVVREYLLKVGVDMEIKPLERGVFTSQWKNRTFPEMMVAGAYQWSYPQSMGTFSNNSDNPAFFNWDLSHERVNEAYKIVLANAGINDELWQKTLKELYPYILEQAPMIWMPAFYTYTMWWPWVGNYRGESAVGYSDSNRFLQYIWVDKALKKSMGY